MQINTHSIRQYLYYFKIDNTLFLLILAVGGLGLVMLYSATSYSQILLIKQITHFIIAFLVMLVIAQIPPRLFQALAPYLLIFGIILLLLVFVIGSSKGGSTRWINLGLFAFQPSEMMKIVIPMAIAAIISDESSVLSVLSIIKSIIAIITVSTLILLQPDLGTAIIIASSGIFVLFFAGIRVQIFNNNYINISVIITTFLTFGSILWQWVLKDYQKNRILTMFNPESDPLGSGYHIIQSKIAIGSGGLFGKGYGQGTQSQLDFLPEHATDFIFATISEEFGFMGVLFLLFLYSLILYRCFMIAKNTENIFSKLLAASLTMVFFLYIFVNISMVSGILPVVGIPLPLVSYGGSSMLTLMTAFGIIMSIEKHKFPSYLS